MRGVRELAELAGDEVRGLLADVDGVISDPLQAARDDDHPQAPLADLGVGPEVEEALDDPPVRAVDQLVEVDEALGAGEVALGERPHRDSDHLLGAAAHLLEGLDERRVVLEVGGQLRQLRDRHAQVGHALEPEVDVQDGEDEPQVDGDGRLTGEELLDALADREVAVVDLVVEGDHLVGELGVLLLERIQRPPQGAEDQGGLLLEVGLKAIQLLLERQPHTSCSSQIAP